MAAVHSFHTVKAVVQIATVEIAVNDLPQTRGPETVRPREPIVIDLNKVLEVVFTAAVIIRPLRVSWSIDSHRKRHWQLVNPTWMEGSTTTMGKNTAGQNHCRIGCLLAGEKPRISDP